MSIGGDVQSNLDLALVDVGVVGKAEVHVMTVGVGAVNDEGGEVIEDHHQINVGLDEGAMSNVLSDLAAVLAEGGLGAGQPVGQAIQRTWSDQAVKDQNQDHATVIHLGRCGTVAVDDRPYLEHLQQRIKHRQGTQMTTQLGAGQ